jgi:hypothetical protein
LRSRFENGFDLPIKTFKRHLFLIKTQIRKNRRQMDYILLFSRRSSAVRCCSSPVCCSVSAHFGPCYPCGCSTASALFFDAFHQQERYTVIFSTLIQGHSYIILELS